jgi:hypothetical protein
MRRAAAVLIAAAALTGCGKTEKSGELGDVLRANDVSVAAQRVDNETPVLDDVTGLGRPAPGYHLIGVRVRACVGRGAAIGTSAFGLQVSDGEARVKFPATNYADDFGSVFAGDCGEGWIVFEAPVRARAKAVTLSYDDTGGGSGKRRATHARFRWDAG